MIARLLHAHTGLAIFDNEVVVRDIAGIAGEDALSSLSGFEFAAVDQLFARDRRAVRQIALRLYFKRKRTAMSGPVGVSSSM